MGEGEQAGRRWTTADRDRFPGVEPAQDWAKRVKKKCQDGSRLARAVARDQKVSPIATAPKRRRREPADRPEESRDLHGAFRVKQDCHGYHRFKVVEEGHVEADRCFVFEPPAVVRAICQGFGMGIWLAKSENMEARERCSSRQGGTRGNRGKEAWANGKVIQGWSGRAVWKDCLGASPELSYPALTPHTC